MPPPDDHEPGRLTTTPSRVVTAEDIAAYARLSGDAHPLHTNAAYAKGTRFGGIVAHGPMVMIVVHGLMVRAGLFDDGAEAFLGLTWSMRAPVRPGDALHAEVVVQSRRASRKDPARTVVVFAFTLVNQAGVRVGEGTWSHLFAARPPQER